MQFFVFRFRKFDKIVFYDFQLNVDGSKEIDEMGIFLIDMDNNFLVLFNFVLVIVGVLFRIEFFSVEGLIVKIYG